MDWAALANYSPGLAAVVLAMYFSNQLSLKYMDERKEMLQHLAEERKEWIDKQEKLLDRYDARMQAAVESISKMTAEIHAVRSRVQEFILKVETSMNTLERRLRGGTSD